MRRPGSRPSSTNSSRRKPRANKIRPVQDNKSVEKNGKGSGKKSTDKPSAKEAPDQKGKTKKIVKSNYRRNNEIGLPSEIFASSINRGNRRVLERTASESHTDEIEYNDIMEEFLAEHLNSSKNDMKGFKSSKVRSPTPEFLSLSTQMSDDSEANPGSRTCNGSSASKC